MLEMMFTSSVCPFEAISSTRLEPSSLLFERCFILAPALSKDGFIKIMHICITKTGTSYSECLTWSIKIECEVVILVGFDATGGIAQTSLTTQNVGRSAGYFGT